MSGELAVGRIYEERAVPDDVKWFWSICGVHAGPDVMKKTDRVPSLERAKAELADNWQKWLAWAKLGEIG